MDIGAGFGAGALVGGIADWFRLVGFAGNMDISFGFKKDEFQIQMNIMSTKSKKDIDFGDVIWEKGKGSIGNLQLNAGRYNAIERQFGCDTAHWRGSRVFDPSYHKENKNESILLKVKSWFLFLCQPSGAEARYEKIIKYSVEGTTLGTLHLYCVIRCNLFW